jgi:transcriptional regulator GlxA family with amidase domain
MTPIRIAMLVSPASTASGVYGLSDVLSSVGTAWELVVSHSRPAPQIQLQLVAGAPATIRCATGGTIVPDAGLDDCVEPDVVLVPGISASPHAAPAYTDRQVFDWLQARREAGTLFASACTGALLLAEAGLLDGRQATTHWAFRNFFESYYPQVHLRVEKNLCSTLDGIITSGGTTAWQHVALYLIDRFCGREQALRTAKFWLLPDTGELQAPYAAAMLPFDHDDTVIRNCQLWMQQHFATDRPVDSMIALSALPPTTFARRFRRATAKSPIEYVHAVRIEAAKALLEGGTGRIDAIGRTIGYEDAASFRRLFKRHTGITPRDYRQLFGPERFERYDSAS